MIHRKINKRKYSDGQIFHQGRNLKSATIECESYSALEWWLNLPKAILVSSSLVGCSYLSLSSVNHYIIIIIIGDTNFQSASHVRTPLNFSWPPVHCERAGHFSQAGGFASQSGHHWNWWMELGTGNWLQGRKSGSTDQLHLCSTSTPRWIVGPEKDIGPKSVWRSPFWQLQKCRFWLTTVTTPSTMIHLTIQLDASWRQGLKVQCFTFLFVCTLYS